MAGATLELLFFGDIVGRAGRRGVGAYLESLEHRPDIVIANVENATHGFGLGAQHYRDLTAMGIQVMTGGNHSWDRKEIFDYIDETANLFRPANFTSPSPGRGAGVVEINGIKLGVLNLIGQVFMGNYNSPWEALEYWVPLLKKQTPLLFVDFHAETTAEKNAFARYAAELGVTAFAGTHTHVLTADARVLLGKMGFITDAGFNGALESIIGMSYEGSFKRLRSNLPCRMEVADSPLVQVNGVRYTIDKTQATTLAVQHIRQIMTLDAE